MITWPMTHRVPAWIVSVSVALAATLGAHFLTYRLSYLDEDARAHALAVGGHGYLSTAPLLISVLLGVLAAALLVRALATAGRGPAPSRTLWWFAAVPPLAFTAQEHLERIAHNGALPVDLAGERFFLIGVVVQLPLALAGMLLVRALLAVADGFGMAMRARRADGRRRIAPSFPRARADTQARVPALATGHAGRAPPLAR